MYEARVEHSTPPEPGLDGALLRITALTGGGAPLPVPLTHADGNPLPALPLGDDVSLPGDEPAIILGYPGITQVVTPTVGIYSNLKDYGAAGGVFLLTDSTRWFLAIVAVPALTSEAKWLAGMCGIGAGRLRTRCLEICRLRWPAASTSCGPSAHCSPSSKGRPPRPSWAPAHFRLRTCARI